VFFKVDFDKTYDKIIWDFIFSILDMKDFLVQFVNWTKAVINNGNVCIMVNDILGPYFQTRKGLRQGDPFSHLLFNITAEVLVVLLWISGSLYSPLAMNIVMSTYSRTHRVTDLRYNVTRVREIFRAMFSESRIVLVISRMVPEWQKTYRNIYGKYWYGS
jgi:hypothetical protein